MKKKFNKNKRGFTLVELLAVIVILGILVAVAVPAVNAILTNARKNTFKTEAASFLDAVNTDHVINATKLEYMLMDDSELLDSDFEKSPFNNYYSEYSFVRYTNDGVELAIDDGEYVLHKSANQNIASATVEKINNNNYEAYRYYLGVNPSDCFVIKDGVIEANDGWVANGCGTKVVIPSILNGTVITRVATSGFDGLEIEEVVISSGIRSIGGSAFASNDLKKVTLEGPNAVFQIDQSFKLNYQGYNCSLGNHDSIINKTGESVLKKIIGKETKEQLISSSSGNCTYELKCDAGGIKCCVKIEGTCALCSGKVTNACGY